MTEDCATGGEVTLRAYADGDLPAVLAVMHAQDMVWWGELDTEEDDASMFIERSIVEHGSAEAGTRAAVIDSSDGERMVGFALMLGHGQSSLAVDPSVPGWQSAQHRLLDWLIESGTERIESPAQDEQRLADLAERGFVPLRSSFDLERSAVIDDLGAPSWPDGTEVVEFHPGDDDQAVHDLIYSVWTDVEGHTHRPIDEWRDYFASGPWFDPGLVVLIRMADGTLGGVAMCRTFSDIGWVMQLATGRHARGLGLGRAILVEAFQRLARVDGVARLGLSVEADNDRALGLYRSVGLDVTREWKHFGLPTP